MNASDDDADTLVNDGCPIVSNSDPVLDVNKSGAVDTLDALLAAKNSSLVKSHSLCLSEG